MAIPYQGNRPGLMAVGIILMVLFMTLVAVWQARPDLASSAKGWVAHVSSRSQRWLRHPR